MLRTMKDNWLSDRQPEIVKEWLANNSNDKTHCQFCGLNKFEVLRDVFQMATIEGHSAMPIIVVICSGCGSISQFPYKMILG